MEAAPFVAQLKVPLHLFLFQGMKVSFCSLTTQSIKALQLKGSSGFSFRFTYKSTLQDSDAGLCFVFTELAVLFLTKASF